MKKRLVLVFGVLALATLAGLLAVQARGGGGDATVTVVPSGLGSGTITSAGSVVDPGVNCTWNGVASGGTCAGSSGGVQTVTVTGNPSPGSVWGGWSDCPGLVSGPGGVNCTYDVNSPADDYTIHGQFNLFDSEATITIQPQGTGSGTVVGNGSVSGPGIINCGWNGAVASGTCTFGSGGSQTIQLTATAGPGSQLTSWTDCPGAISGRAAIGLGTGTVCTITVNDPSDDFTVHPRFDPVTTQSLTVSLGGTGGGTVITNPAAISCTRSGGVQSGTCAAGLAQGSQVILTAQAAAGSTFVGSWGGACAAFGSNPQCTLTMSGPQVVSATFTATGGGGGACTIVGTAGPDILNGTPGANVICGRGGNDIINGKGGNDILKGEKGADVIKGGKGADTMFGGKGADTLLGGKGNDIANGGPGADVCTAEVKVSC